MPFFSCILILLAAHLFDVLFGGNLDDFPRQLGVVFDVVSEVRDDAAEGIVSLEEIILDGDSDFFKDHALRIQNLQNFKHVNILVQDTLSDNSWDQQSFFDLAIEILSHFAQLNYNLSTSGALSRHFLSERITFRLSGKSKIISRMCLEQCFEQMK